MSVEIDSEDLKGRSRIENGDELTGVFEDDDLTYQLSLVKSISLHELHLSIFLEYSGNELESVGDHYTFERYDVDEVTELIHGMSAEEVMTHLMDVVEEAFG